MSSGYWLINYYRSEVRKNSENRANQDQFNNYIFIDNEKIIGVLVKEPPLNQNREEFKIEEAREIWKRLIAKGWRRTNLFD